MPITRALVDSPPQLLKMLTPFGLVLTPKKCKTDVCKAQHLKKKKIRRVSLWIFLQRMKKKGDHRPRNSAQYERVVNFCTFYLVTVVHVTIIEAAHRKRYTTSKFSVFFTDFIGGFNELRNQRKKTLEKILRNHKVTALFVTRVYMCITRHDFDCGFLHFVAAGVVYLLHELPQLWNKPCFMEHSD